VRLLRALGFVMVWDEAVGALISVKSLLVCWLRRLSEWVALFGLKLAASISKLPFEEIPSVAAHL